MIGRTLAHYRVTAAIGAGGMGEVYRATDTKLGRDVALKVLPAGMAATPERLDRFRREAKALAALDHPGIVTVYSVEEAEGVHFLTMQLVEGESLDRLIPEDGLALDRLNGIAGALAEALAAAHDKGIVHRDLKPANVMVTADGRVKVLDFGLARMTGPPEDPSSRSELPTDLLTREGTVMGTVPYMSPEQLTGAAIDHRTDLFSLGIILYEMAAGRRPFEGRSPAELASAILRDAPRPLAESRTDLPAALGAVIQRCLEKRAADRPATAREVREALRAAEREAPALAEAGRAAAPVAARSGGGVAIAVLPFSDMSPARDQQYLCEGMAEEVMNALVRVAGIRVASRTSAFRAGREEKDLAAIGRALSVDQVLEGSVRTAAGRLRVTARLSDVATGYQVWSERYDRGTEDVFAVQDEIAAGVVDAVKARLSSGEHAVPARSPGGNLEAYRAYLQGRYLRHTKNDPGGALRAFEQAVSLDPSFGPAWVGVAESTVLAAHYSLVPARAAYARATAALATARSLQGETADGLYVDGFRAYMAGDWPAADAAYRRALELEPRHVQALGSYGMILSVRGRVEEGFALLARAREADPLAAFPYAITGSSLVSAGRPLEAERFLEDAFSFEKDNALALWSAGVGRIALGRYEEGIAAAEQAVAVTRRGSFFVGVLGWALATTGCRDEARALLEELRARPAPAPTAVSEAWLLGALGKRDAAFEVLDRAVEERQACRFYVRLPAFDALRNDPRFDAYVERLRLSHP